MSISRVGGDARTAVFVFVAAKDRTEYYYVCDTTGCESNIMGQAFGINSHNEERHYPRKEIGECSILYVCVCACFYLLLGAAAVFILAAGAICYCLTHYIRFCSNKFAERMYAEERNVDRLFMCLHIFISREIAFP